MKSFDLYYKSPNFVILQYLKSHPQQMLIWYLWVKQFDLKFQENKIIKISHMEFDIRPVNNYKLSRQFRVISVLKSDFDISR